MVKFMQKEMRLLSQYLAQKYNIKIKNSSKEFSVSSFFNALDVFMKCIKTHNYAKLLKKYNECFEFANYHDNNDDINPAKLGTQLEALRSLVLKKECIEFERNSAVAVISSPYLYEVIETGYRNSFKDKNMIITDYELRLITDQRFAYNILEGMSIICIKFLTEYIQHVGPGSDRKEIISRGLIEEILIKKWFNMKCRKLKKCKELANMYYERTKDYPKLS